MAPQRSPGPPNDAPSAEWQRNLPTTPTAQDDSAPHRDVSGSRRTPKKAPGPGRGYHRRMAIYLDHAATTSIRPEVLDVMLSYLTEH